MFATVMSSLAVVALAIFVSQMAQQLDEELNACGTGVFKDGKCECVNPYTGKHCQLVNCGYGEIIDGNKYWTYGADKKIGENFSMYAGYEVTDKPTGTDTTNMAAGIKFTF